MFVFYTRMPGKRFIFILVLWQAVAQAQKPEFMLPLGHTMEITSVEFSPDGKLVLTASVDNTVKIWDAYTGRLLRNFQAPEMVNLARFSPNQQMVIAGLANNTTRVWHVRSGNKLRDHKERTDGGNGEEGVRSIEFSPDGKLFLVVSEFNIVKIWETASGRLVRDFSALKPTSATFLSNGEVEINFSVLGPEGYLNKTTAYEISTGATVKSASQPLSAVRVVSDEAGNYIVTKNGKRLCTPAVTDKTRLSVSKDGNFALSFPYEEQPKLWNLATCSVKRDLISEVTAANFSDDGKLLVTSFKEIASVWDLGSGELVAELSGYTIPVNYSFYHPNQPEVVTIHADHSAAVWNLSSGRIEHLLTQPTAPITAATYSPDGSRLAIASEDSTILIYDRSWRSFPIQETGVVEQIVFSPTGKLLISSTYDGSRLWSTSGSLIGDLIGFSPDHATRLTFAADESLFYIIDQGEITAWSTSDANQLMDENLARLRSMKQSGLAFSSRNRFSSDRKLYLDVEGTWRPAVDILNSATGKKLKSLHGHTGVVVDAAFSPDGKYAITGSSDNAAILWNIETGAVLKRLEGHRFYVHSVGFSPDGKKAITSAGDNTTRLWSVPDGKLICTFFSVGEQNHFFHMSGDYYSATKTAAALVHYATPDLKFISFEQLDAKYNRPDLVLKALSSTDTALIKAFHKAYLKRLSKLEINEIAFKTNTSAPEADFSNRDTTRSVHTSGEMKLKIRAKDSNAPLDRWNIWINETPLFGSGGISLRARHLLSFDTTIVVTLSEGENLIETSVVNQQGVESFRKPMYVKYIPLAPEKQTLHFIGIGINRFAQPGHDLSWSVKDIRDLSDSLKARYGNNIIIDTLFDKNVTVSNITALKKKLLATSVNDKVIISYSGHGLLSKDFDYFLSTYLVNFDKPDEHGLPYEILEGLLDSIPARNKLMLIDACHSGEVDKEEMEKYVLVEKALEDSGTKSSRKPIPADGHLGMMNSFELMQDVFVNIGRSTGATVISAAAGTQFAQEKSELQNGVFTYSILEYMKTNPSATVSELRRYVNKRVSELTQGMQVPTSRSETRAVDWRVW